MSGMFVNVVIYNAVDHCHLSNRSSVFQRLSANVQKHSTDAISGCYCFVVVGSHTRLAYSAIDLEIVL